MARTGSVLDTDTSLENNLVAAPSTSWIPGIGAVPDTTKEMWMSTDTVPVAGTNHGFRQTFHITQIIDDGEDEDDEEDSHDHDPRTVHFGLIEEAGSENDQTAKMAGKHVNDEQSDAAMHHIGICDSDLCAGFW